MHIFSYYFQFFTIGSASLFCEKLGKVCSALLSLAEKPICYILASKLAPSLVYHLLIKALLSLALQKLNYTMEFRRQVLSIFTSREKLKNRLWNSILKKTGEKLCHLVLLSYPSKNNLHM